MCRLFTDHLHITYPSHFVFTILQPSLHKFKSKSLSHTIESAVQNLDIIPIFVANVHLLKIPQYEYLNPSILGV